MRVDYSGLELKLMRTVLWDQRTVSDPTGLDLLCIHYRLGFVFMVNASATAAGLQKSQLPGQTLPEILRKLSAHRGRLRVMDDAGNVVLDSHRRIQGFLAPCDVMGGPKVVACNVVEVHGIKTYVVYWEVETWGNTCKARDNPLLSNRWTEHHSIDRRGYTTRTVKGEARFRKDALLNYGTYPDAYRWWLSPYRPNNTIRLIDVEESADGLTYAYTFQDVEQPRQILGNSPVAEFDGHYSSGFDYTSGLFPTRWESLSVELWGYSYTERERLVRLLNVIAAEVGFTDNVLNAGALPFGLCPYHVEATVGLRDKYARLEAKWMPGAVVNAVNNIFAPDLRAKLIRATRDNTVWADNGPAWGIQSRGLTYGSRIITQELQGACERPTAVPALQRAGLLRSPG